MLAEFCSWWRPTAVYVCASWLVMMCRSAVYWHQPLAPATGNAAAQDAVDFLDDGERAAPLYSLGRSGGVSSCCGPRMSNWNKRSEVASPATGSRAGVIPRRCNVRRRAASACQSPAAMVNCRLQPRPKGSTPAGNVIVRCWHKAACRRASIPVISGCAAMKLQDQRPGCRSMVVMRWPARCLHPITRHFLACCRAVRRGFASACSRCAGALRRRTSCPLMIRFRLIFCGRPSSHTRWHALLLPASAGAWSVLQTQIAAGVGDGMEWNGLEGWTEMDDHLPVGRQRHVVVGRLIAPVRFRFDVMGHVDCDGRPALSDWMGNAVSPMPPAVRAGHFPDEVVAVIVGVSL